MISSKLPCFTNSEVMTTTPKNPPFPSHHHDHKDSEHSLLQGFGSLFECCLTEETPSISTKLQTLREHHSEPKIEHLTIDPNQEFTITPDMIIGDVLFNFPATKDLLQEIHPLGLLSPALHQITIAMFLGDINADPEEICQQLSALIKPKNV